MALVIAGALVLGGCNTTPAFTLTPEQQARVTSAERLKAQSEATPITYVGKLEGSSAYIALVNRAGEMLVYVCDGTEQSVTISSWYEGTLNGKTIVAKLREDSSRTLNATLNGDSITGTVMLGSGANLSFSASLSAEPSGLWQASQADAAGEAINQGAWIVLPDGTQHGALKSHKPPRPAEPVGPVKPIDNLSPIGSVSDRALPGMAPGQPCRNLFDRMQKLLVEVIASQEDYLLHRISHSYYESLDFQLEKILIEWNEGGTAGNGVSCDEVTGISAYIPSAV
ncbi:MAG: hypothetical protein HC933_05780 [Pleurocapsa sp. SU_196_0]|nr:hypothetical protein [Pleurocapsa sp. SU_196_0]